MMFRQKMTDFAFLVVVLIIVLLFFCFFYVTMQRIDYPYEIEWIEGGVLHQVTRILEGQKLYTSPSLEFIPALYTPLYYYFSAFLVKILGWGFLPLRLLSLSASIGVMSMIAWMVYVYSQSRMHAFIGAGIFVAMFRFTDFWFDVARVDSLWTFFLSVTLTGMLVYRIKPSITVLLIAGFSYALAIYTKQSSLFLGPFLVVSLWLIAGWRGWLVFGLASIIPVLILLLFFQWQSDGLFYYFTMEMARSHGFNVFGLALFLTSDTIFSIPVFIVMAGLFCFYGASSRKDFWAIFILLVGFMAISLVSRAYPGGHLNVLMPFYMCVSIYAALYLCQISVRNVSSERGKENRGITVFILYLLITANLLWAFYPLSVQIPNKENQLAGDRLVEKIRETNGRVCVTSHAYLAYMAGKDFCAHNTQLTDLMWSSSKNMRDLLSEDIKEKVLSGYYSAIVLDSKGELSDWMLTYNTIPYKVSKLNGFEAFRQVVSGGNPAIWLSFEPKNAPKRATYKK